jgi:NodT family efflux transporter outer membrane factor (OMF) lipoprotein
MNAYPIRIAVLAALLAATGCASQAARPVTPEIALPAQFHSAAPAAGATRADAGRWWTVFGDTELDALVDRALHDNPDLSMARSRIAGARAQLGTARAAFLPQVDATTGAERVQQSRNGLFGAATRSGAFPDLYSSHHSGIDASWELDLFGALREQRRSAAAGVDAAQADHDALRLSLPAEIVRVYVDHVVLSQQLLSTERSLRASEQRLALQAERHAQGDASEQSVVAARLDAEQIRSRLPRLRASRESLRHAMAALLGSTGHVALPESSPVLQAAPALLDGAIVAGMPSELLRRRPDIRSAEAQYRQAFAAHRIAIADQYPRFALGGSIGQESLNAGDLLKAASQAWTLAAQVTMPLFDGGRRKSTKNLRRAQLDEAMAGYRKTVVEALADVEQSMLARQGAQQSLDALARRSAEASRFLSVEQARYQEGDSALPQLLEAQISREQAGFDELEACGEALRQYLHLQKSLGGPAGGGETPS